MHRTISKWIMSLISRFRQQTWIIRLLFRRCADYRVYEILVRQNNACRPTAKSNCFFLNCNGRFIMACSWLWGNCSTGGGNRSFTRIGERRGNVKTNTSPKIHFLRNVSQRRRYFTIICYLFPIIILKFKSSIFINTPLTSEKFPENRMLLCELEAKQNWLRSRGPMGNVMNNWKFWSKSTGICRATQLNQALAFGFGSSLCVPFAIASAPCIAHETQRSS